MLHNKHKTQYFANGLLLSIFFAMLVSLYFNNTDCSVVKDQTKIVKIQKRTIDGPPDGAI